MTTRKLIYVSAARLPTEKAHGYQICKMCEAFSNQGLEVVLLHPFRKQSDSAMAHQSAFDYYAIPRVYQIETLSNWDSVAHENFFPKSLRSFAYFLHNAAWGLYASRISKTKNADLYYSRDIEIAYWLVRKRLPTIFEAHTVPKKIGKFLFRSIVRSPSLLFVVTVTHLIKEEFMKWGIPSQKILVLSDAVDLTMYENLPNQEECKRRLGLPSEHPLIGYIGRFQTLDSEKGIPELVQAVAQLQRIRGKREPMLLCVGGPMDKVPSYQAIARKVGALEKFIGFHDRVPNTDVPFWIAACDIVTIPWPRTELSAKFTSPMKLFEYLAAGKPIVSSNLPAIREILRHGDNGWLVEPGQPDALAKGIQILFEDENLRATLGANAKNDAKKFSWEKRASAVLSFVTRYENNVFC